LPDSVQVCGSKKSWPSPWLFFSSFGLTEAKLMSVLRAMHPYTDRGTATLRVRAFGQLSIETTFGTVSAKQLGSVKARQLFEILLLSRNSVVSKGTLAEELWDGSLPRNVSATIENYVSILRQHLFEDPILARSVIVTAREGYRLCLDQVTCDLDEFDDLLAEARQAPSSFLALDLYDRALALAREEVLLDETSGRWVHGVRDRYRLRVLKAHLEVGELHLQLGRTRNAEHHADTALALEPLNECAVRLAMRVANAMGSQRRALGIYENCRRGLAEQFGLIPSEATRELELEILRQDGAESAQPTSKVSSQVSAEICSPQPADQPSAQAPDGEAFTFLLKACVAANEKGGRDGVLRLLREASTLERNFFNGAISLVVGD
jgi:SARP family transcriptional regulator, regulator of embCAB operon